MYSKKWEEIDDYSERLKVPGGWIVRSYWSGMYSRAMHQVFIADPNRNWIFSDKDKEKSNE